jgi:nucleoside-diphosphate-sugar epimerase
MRILVIGGTGFIGPFVVRELERLGHEVAVFHRKAPDEAPAVHSRHIIGDRRRLADSASDIRGFAPEVVVDVILSSGKQAHELMDVCLSVGARRVVALSSMDVYRACGVTHRLEEGPLEPLPLTESSALRTKLRTYPAAQVTMLQTILEWLDDEYDKIPVEREILGEPNLPGTVLRLPMVYGPGDKLHRFHPWIKRIDDGRRTILLSEEMARWRATKGYVENVADAVATAATNERAAGRIFNVGEPDALPEIDWARMVARQTGWNGELIALPRDRVPSHLAPPGNPEQHWVADTTRLREELGYRERVSREEGVRRTVEWERSNPPSGVTPHQFDYAAEDKAMTG